MRICEKTKVWSLAQLGKRRGVVKTLVVDETE